MNIPASPSASQRAEDNPSLDGRPITLAVFAPFGSDSTLSYHPDGVARPLEKTAFVNSLLAVSKTGVHVAALVDRKSEGAWWLNIPPGGQPQLSRVAEVINAADPRHLQDLLFGALAVNTEAAVVLCIEGHGAGFVPDIDAAKLTEDNFASLSRGVVRWQIPNTGPFDEDGNPILPMVYPLPGAAPLLADNQPLLSTWALGEALRVGLLSKPAAGRKIAVLHLNNCFNFAVEVLHTVSPYAHFATGYMNYNFFTAGASYPAVFEELKAISGPTARDLAQLFARENRRALEPASGEVHDHPTTGGAIQLSKMRAVTEGVDRLAKALITALPRSREVIRRAIVRAQKYDTGSGFGLRAPDQLTDLCDLAVKLYTSPELDAAVKNAAQTLFQAMDGVKQYGERGRPWFTADGIEWEFGEPPLGMSIFCPDPDLSGVWDWRSPYYLIDAHPALPNVIGFLRHNAWRRFVIEYHKGAAFQTYLPAVYPDYPPLRQPVCKMP